MNPLRIRWNQKKHPRQDQGPGGQNPIARAIRRYLNKFGHRFAVLHFDRKISLQRSLVKAIIGRIMDNMVTIRYIQNGNRLDKLPIHNQLIIDGHHGTVRRGTRLQNNFSGVCGFHLIGNRKVFGTRRKQKERGC